MPDLRYHLVSLISVFLALAIGILLGVALANRGVVTQSLQDQISSIQRRFDYQQSQINRRDREIQTLREKTSQNEAMLDAMSDDLVSGRLTGVETAVVFGPYADRNTTDSVVSALRSAGANITSSERLPAPSSIQDVTSQQTTTPMQNDYSGTAARVARERGGFSSPPQAVVFVGGGAIPTGAPQGTLQALNEAEAGMLDAWKKSGLRVVGTEGSSTRRSEVQLFQSAGIPSTDNADSPAGRATIVRLLVSTDDDSSYGTKRTATALFPPPEQQ